MTLEARTSNPEALRKERRRHPRHRAGGAVTLLYHGQSETLRLLDVSQSGAGLSRPLFAPRPGERVELFLPEVGWLEARTARSEERRLGLAFELSEVERARLIARLLDRLPTLH